jgi:non-ribosomal peptide synthetase component F
MWSILLSRYSREQDVLFGMVVSGRPSDLANAETMVGLFVNSLPLRVDVKPCEPVAGWLKALQAQQIEMRQYEYSPLLDVQSWSEIPRGLPMFESILAYQNYPPIESLESRLHDLKISELRVSDQTSLPFVLQVTGNGSTLSFRFSYDANRFDDGAIERMACHMRTLVENVAADPDRCIGDLQLLSSGEQQSLLASWKARQAETPQLYCLHERFEEQAKKTPDAIALTCDDRQLTYDELNRQANQLARYLQGKGVGPEVVVGLCMDRSIPMIVAVLGILKAGGVYLPLDPDYPQSRLEFMLDDSRAPLLLTQHDLLAKFSDHKAQVLCIDTDWDRIAENRKRMFAAALLSITPHTLFTRRVRRGAEGHLRHSRQCRPIVRRNPAVLSLWPSRCLDNVSLARIRLLHMGSMGRASFRRPRGDRSLLRHPLA